MAETGSHRSGTEPAMWDWRAFWMSRATTSPLHDILENGARWKHSRFVDHYLMIEGRQDNIKIRSGSLQVKQFIEQYDGFRAYRRKQYFRFPLAARRLLCIFPRLSEPDRVFTNAADLLSTLTNHDYQPRCYDVSKERWKCKVRGVEFERTKVEVATWRFFSVALTGPELESVARAATNLPTDSAVGVGGYTELLAHIAMESGGRPLIASWSSAARRSLDDAPLPKASSPAS
jgi:hypothetical protein